jgi:integrase
MGIYKPQGSKFYWFSTTNQGIRHRENTKATNKKLAEQIYRKRVDGLAREKHFPDENLKSFPFTKLVERYLAEITSDKSLNSQADESRFALVLTNFFGDKLLNQITPDLVFQFKLQRRKDFAKKWKCRLEKEKSQLKKLGKEALKAFEGKGRHFGKRTINRELGLLSAMFNQAIKVWRWCSFNPVSGVKREKENKRVKYFTPEVFAQIFDCLPDWVRPIVLLAKYTGLRRANVVNLKWSQVDMKQRMVILDAGVMKNSEHLGIPLNEQAYRILEIQKNHKVRAERSNKMVLIRSAFVFCHNNGTEYTAWGVTRAFKKACRKAGYPDFRFHDLRHDFCSQLVQQGVDLYAVKELAGHKDIATTQRYAHLSPERLRKAVEALPSHA